MAQTLEAPTEQKSDLEDENKFSHYAEKVSITEGYILGSPVIAICGKIFIPSRDPKKFPICPICKELAEALFLSSE
jgi:hypothetical protein